MHLLLLFLIHFFYFYSSFTDRSECFFHRWLFAQLDCYLFNSASQAVYPCECTGSYFFVNKCDVFKNHSGPQENTLFCILYSLCCLPGETSSLGN